MTVDTIWYFVKGILLSGLGFCILVFFHELGHCVVGRLCGIGVVDFAIGFGRSIFSFKWLGINFRLNWIPFGGYCRFKGQDDFGKADIKHEPDEFYERPAWARFFAVIAGPAASFSLGIIIYFFVFQIAGINQTVNRPITITNPAQIIESGVKALSDETNGFLSTITRQSRLSDSVSQTNKAGLEGLIQNFIALNDPSQHLLSTYVLKDGDIITHINGQKVSYMEEITEKMMANLNDTIKLTVMRTDPETGAMATMDLNFKPRVDMTKVDSSQVALFGFSFKENDYVTVAEFEKESNGEKLGLKKEDKITAIDQHSLSGYQSLRNYLSGDYLKNRSEITLEVDREGKKTSLTIPKKDLIFNKEENRYLIGFKTGQGFDSEMVRLSLVDAIKESFNKTFGFISGNIKGMGSVASGDIPVNQAVAGPLRLLLMFIEMASKSFLSFITFVAVFSIALGFTNLLPIPAVDGGHAVLSLIEIIIRRNIPLTIIYRIQMIGVFIILSLLVLVSFNDITNTNFASLFNR